MLKPENILEPEWIEWVLLTPLERLKKSSELWSLFILYRGDFAPDADRESPFFDKKEWDEIFANREAGLRSIRRSGV